MSIDSYLGQEFTVDTVSGIIQDTDTFLNILKRREQVLYRSTLPTSASNVAYIESTEVNANLNLSIADRSTSLQANRITNVDAIDITSSKSFNISTDSFLVTDIYTTEKQTITPLPLFYKHTLANITRDSDGDLDTDVVLISVQLLDSFLQSIDITEYYLNSTKGIVYTNILSNFISLNNYAFYYVKYTVREGNTIETYTDILDNVPVYILATFDDLDTSLKLKTDGRKVYLIEELIGGGYEVTLPATGSYSYKTASSSRLKILSPATIEATDPWYVRVTNGNFNSEIDGTLYKYYVAEFLSQFFTPEAPIKQSVEEYSRIITDSIIKTDQENIYQDDTLELYIDILISDKNDIALAAFTTNPDNTGTTADNGETFQTWDTTDRVGIRSVDHLSGFIDIDGFILKPSYIVVSTYYFKETNYEFTLVDMNPLTNKDALNSRTVLFINPEESGTTKTSTLNYMIVDESGKVVESNWDSFDNDTQTYPTTSGTELYYDLKPSWKDAGPHNIFTNLSTETTSGTLLILGDMTTAESQNVSNLATFDSRRRGGGIVETFETTVSELEPESEWYWDQGYWDGIPYPGNASYMVELPITVLDGAGGTFLMNEVKEVVDKHTAAGVYPVTKGYGVEISISGVSPTVSGVILTWFSHGY